MELRKQKEKEYANRLKSLLEGAGNREKLASNEKFYAIARESRDYLNKWLLERISGDKTFLDYCCGDGGLVLFLAEKGAKAAGMDISDVSIEIARKKARIKGLEDRVEFLVMDGENLKFKDNSFDFIVCNGVLHHLDIEKAYSELSRVLKPKGEIICVEPLIYNPIFHLYRRFTPHLRTEWETEHILRKKDIFLAKKYFDKIEFRFFHLISLAAVPFRNRPIFNFILRPLEILDSVLLKLPFLKWWAWQVMFILSEQKNPPSSRY